MMRRVIASQSLIALWVGFSPLRTDATNLRRHEAVIVDLDRQDWGQSVLSDAAQYEMDEEKDARMRWLASAACPAFECVPSVHLATIDQAKADNGGAETNYYGSTDANIAACAHKDPTVLQLSGVESCHDAITSVQFTLLWRGVKLRDSVETVPPYTVFGDDAASGGFGSRVLPAGGYNLTVTVSSPRCHLWSGTFAFDVIPCTAAPTSAPTAPPTQASSDQPSDVPSMAPTAPNDSSAPVGVASVP